jgi:hypothetical protein
MAVNSASEPDHLPSHTVSVLDPCRFRAGTPAEAPGETIKKSEVSPKPPPTLCHSAVEETTIWHAMAAGDRVFSKFRPGGNWPQDCLGEYEVQRGDCSRTRAEGGLQKHRRFPDPALSGTGADSQSRQFVNFAWYRIPAAGALSSSGRHVLRIGRQCLPSQASLSSGRCVARLLLHSCITI